MFLGLLNPDPTSELPYNLRFFEFPNLKVQNTQFFAILGVILYMQVLFQQMKVG